MFTKKIMIHTASVCFIIMLLLTGVLPAQAETLVSPLTAGSTFAWAKNMGGTTKDSGESIAVDTNGNVYTTGSFYATADFNPGEGVAELTSAGGDDIFVSKLDSNGNYVWAKNMGGTGYDNGNSIVVDSGGAVYTTGYFQGTADFNPGGGVAELTSAGENDIFISKLDSAGNFVWAKNMGGTGDDYGQEITVDSSGNVYITGSFSATASFNPDDSTAELVSAGEADIFVAKFGSQGNFIWARRMGGTGADVGNSVVTDASGIYFTGSFAGTADFDPGEGTANLISAGSGDIFVSKLDSGGSFAWAKSMGGANEENGDNGSSIVVDTAHNVYTTGYFYGTADFDPGENVVELTSAGEKDIFVSKLNSDGSFAWAKSMGGGDNDESYEITVDLAGSIYTTGYFYGFADFDPGQDTYYLGSAGGAEIFISKLGSDGNFDWATRMGGTSGDVGYGIALDSDGGVYATGFFQGNAADFDPGEGVSNLSSAGGLDIFISKFDEENVIGGYKVFLPLVLKNSQ